MENSVEITKSKKQTVASLSISEASDTLALANDVSKYIRELKLYQNIQGKEFVNVEGWQYAGSRLGIIPVVEYIKDRSTDQELKYEAKVNLLNLRSGQVIGAGFAVCSNKEQGKKFYQEFAIASMAQTRAIGKAYRNILAWIIRAAGYEPTPAEEMDYNGNVPEVKVEQPVAAPAKPAVNAVPEETPQPVVAEAPVSNGVKYASAKQKEEIIRLLNNPVITRQEKTKMLLSINKLDEERAAQAITKLKKVVAEREEQSGAAEEEAAGGK